MWSKTTPGERARLLLKVADMLDADADRMALLETTDNGKVIRETHNQMGYAARIFRYYAAWADKLHGDVVPLDQKDTIDLAILRALRRDRRDHRVDSPVAILTNTLPAALAAGNCIVIKPSEHASVTTLEIARMVEKAGFPAGVVNIVTGEADTGKALTVHPEIDKISSPAAPASGAISPRPRAATSSR